ncbi:MAG: type II toxin-antitoxin system prevent-host-death family antitoxin [Lautropia sp.]|nr:type II toxin-antitoxin system prevent-host-death family antitoxin [Lautropia sp.]
MDKSISASEANRHFSRLLRNVLAGDRYVITSHGRPVAQVTPVTDDTVASANRKAAFLEQLAAKPVIQADAWKRDDLYDDPSS